MFAQMTSNIEILLHTFRQARIEIIVMVQRPTTTNHIHRIVVAVE